MTLAQQVVAWFDVSGRDLPWRRAGTTAWGVLVSEVMLQQTPAARVAPLWPQWMTRWPTPAGLSAAPQAEVLRAWGKLGYPRRALRLHETARALTAGHGGAVPSDVQTLIGLPGIGSYTARAVAAFAYQARVPVVDTNVRRVVARAVHGSAEPGATTSARDLADVEALLPPEPPAAARFSAALMELGALVCTARSPRCDRCPLRTRCAWRQAGRPPWSGPPRRAQRFAGTDRQVRGRLLDVLRAAPQPVPRAALDTAWGEAGQRERCLESLCLDGLVEQLTDGRFALPGQR